MELGLRERAPSFLSGLSKPSEQHSMPQLLHPAELKQAQALMKTLL